MSGMVTGPQWAWIERVLGVGQGERALPKPSGGGGGAKVAFMQARLAWDTARKQVQAALQRLEKAVLADCAEEPDFPTIKTNARLLYTVMDYLDERLVDALDAALNAEPGPSRQALADEARAIIEEYRDYVANDDLLRDIDDNGFVEIGIIATVTQKLKAIEDQLKAA